MQTCVKRKRVGCFILDAKSWKIKYPIYAVYTQA